MVLAAASLVVLPYLSRDERAIVLQLRSGTLAAEAKQTLVCVYLSVILLGGLLLDALMGWWWADPVVAVALVPLIT